MAKQDWIWMPHPAHFICSHACRFVLATHVNGYIVSTVGEYFPDSSVREIFAKTRGKVIKGKGGEWDANYLKDIGFEEVGCDRKYETMVFRAVPNPQYNCCPYAIDVGDEKDFRGYNDPGDAYKGHIELCEKYDAIKKEM